MTYDLLTALCLFAFATSITPGPNNLMLMSSGATFGIRRTFPHMAGVAAGFVAMTIAIGAGLMQVFETHPTAFEVLRWISLAFLLWLAWKIATAVPAAERRTTGRPITFLQAAAFQWANPKAWMMALGAIGAFAPDQTLGSVAMVAVVFGAVNLPSVGVWAFLGTQLRRILNTEGKLRAFNVCSALLLVASMIPVLREGV